MRAKWVAVALLMAALSSCIGSPAVQWTRTFEGWGDARGTCVQQTADGGYIAAGRTTSSDSIKLAAILLAKLDSVGTTEWQTTITGSGGLGANSVVQTKDGGYLLSGCGVLVDGCPDNAVLIKTDARGRVQWQRAVSGSVSASGYSIVKMGDSGYVLVAQKPAIDSGVILYMTDSMGRRKWARKYAVAYPELGTVTVSGRRTADGGFIIGARSLLKLNSRGNLQWARAYEDLAGSRSVLQTADGGYVATGPNRDSGICLLKTDKSGAVVWTKPLVAHAMGDGTWVEAAADGGFVVAGYYSGPERWRIATVFRTTSDGMQLWADSLCNGEAQCVRQTRDDGYVVTGRFYVPAEKFGTSYMFVTKLAPERKR